MEPLVVLGVLLVFDVVAYVFGSDSRSLEREGPVWGARAFRS